MKMKNTKPVQKPKPKQKKKSSSCFSFFCCCCARPQEVEENEQDQKYKDTEPQSKLNLHTPPEQLKPPKVQQPPTPQEDLTDLISEQYSSSESRKVAEETFGFPLPDLHEYPVMQVYEHHLVRISTNELIA